MAEVLRELSCQEVVELVNDYLEGALPEGEKSAFDQHLAICEGCSEYLRQIQAVRATAARLRAEDIPGGIRESLLDAFRNWKRQP